jgi:hypothetical protein
MAAVQPTHKERTPEQRQREMVLALVHRMMVTVSVHMQMVLEFVHMMVAAEMNYMDALLLCHRVIGHAQMVALVQIHR